MAAEQELSPGGAAPVAVPAGEEGGATHGHASPASVRPHLGGDVRRTTLPNGMRVVTEDMRGSHTLSLGWFINVGSRHEGAGLTGAAHYLEHVLFKGTATHSAEELSAVFDHVGGEVNAYTAKEHTAFHCKVLAEDGDIAFDCLAEMLTASLIRTADFEAERSVILDEISLHNDDPLEVAHTCVAAHLYPGHPLGREVLGSRESISAITRGQVHSFWRRHYRPCDIVVSAAGRVDHDKLVRRLSALPGVPTHSRRLAAPAALREPALTMRTRATEQCSVVLGLRGVGYFDERRYATTLLSLILGGGMSSRLFVEVRERRGLAYHIEMADTSYGDAGHACVEWLCAPQVVPEILSLVSAEVLDIVANGVSEEELARAKGQLRGQTLLAFESPDARMMRLGRSELAGDHRSMDAVLDRSAAVSVDEVVAVARDIFCAPPVLAVAGAKCDRPRLDRAIRRWQGTVGQVAGRVG